MVDALEMEVYGQTGPKEDITSVARYDTCNTNVAPSNDGTKTLSSNAELKNDETLRMFQQLYDQMKDLKQEFSSFHGNSKR